MTLLTNEETNDLNRINSGTQRVGLGDILARIEKSIEENRKDIKKLRSLITKNKKA